MDVPTSKENMESWKIVEAQSLRSTNPLPLSLQRKSMVEAATRDAAATRLLPFFKSCVACLTDENDRQCNSECSSRGAIADARMIYKLQDETAMVPVPFPSADNGDDASDGNPPIYSLLCMPEAMLQIYAFLSDHDRLYSLALVNKSLNTDKVRSGFYRPSFGEDDLSLTAVVARTLKRKLVQCSSNPKQRQRLLDEYIQTFEQLGRTDLAQRLFELRNRKATPKDIMTIAFDAAGRIPTASASTMRSYMKNIIKRRSNTSSASRSHWMVDLVDSRQLVSEFVYGDESNLKVYNRLIEECSRESRILKARDPLRRMWSGWDSRRKIDENLFAFLQPSFTLFLPDPDVGWKTRKIHVCRRCKKYRGGTQVVTAINRRHQQSEKLCPECLQTIFLRDIAWQRKAYFRQI